MAAPRVRHAAAPRRPARARTRVKRALLGGCALGVASGWNLSNTGAIATQLAHRYGVGLAVVGLWSRTLVLGIVTRPLGGWILHRHPTLARVCVAASLAGGAAGTLLLVAANPPAVAALGAALVGVAAGIPFSPAFTAPRSSVQTRRQRPSGS